MKLIVAHDKNNGIGFENKLPWNHTCDLRYFSKLTKGLNNNNNNCIIMGKNTYLSIGRPLPNRKNIVLSTTLQDDNITIFPTLELLLEYLNNNVFDDIWVIGGLQIYNLFLSEKLINELFVTYINKEYQCDTYFPFIENDFIEDISYRKSEYSDKTEIIYKKFMKN